MLRSIFVRLLSIQLVNLLFQDFPVLEQLILAHFVNIRPFVFGDSNLEAIIFISCDVYGNANLLLNGLFNLLKNVVVAAHKLTLL